MSGFIRAGVYGEIQEGELRAFELPQGRICIAHAGGELFALSDECTHGGCSLAEEGRLVDEETVECGRDESRFDLETGEPVGGPAVDPLKVFRVQVVDGWVEVGPPVDE
jgi:3-phenylpropionate/trans-cinnamate dioxygenase ferredoxin subunit